jgi:hypothetical protein
LPFKQRIAFGSCSQIMLAGAANCRIGNNFPPSFIWKARLAAAGRASMGFALYLHGTSRRDRWPYGNRFLTMASLGPRHLANYLPIQTSKADIHAQCSFLGKKKVHSCSLRVQRPMMQINQESD